MLAGEVRAGRFHARNLQLDAGEVADGNARLYVRPHDLALTDGDGGIPAQVRALHRLADRITLELVLVGQERVVELDLVDRAGSRVPAIGDEVHVQALRYRVFPA